MKKLVKNLKTIVNNQAGFGPKTMGQTEEIDFIELKKN
jgi:hypothetical protein